MNDGMYAKTMRETDDPQLYASYRLWYSSDFFVAPGFHLPLPNGPYEVTVHFVRATIFPADPDKRTVDVIIEDQIHLPGYVVGTRGFRVPEPKTFDVEVGDGQLDVVFRVPWRATVAALEVRRLW